MSNRKLMGALSILLLAALFMAIGCGDGKRRSHANVRRMNTGGKVGGDPKSVAEKSKKLDAIDKPVRALEDGGQPIALQSLQAGSYQLTSVLGYVKFIRKQDNLSAVAEAPVQNGQLGSGSASNEGLIGGDTDEQRQVELPLSFTAQAGGTISPLAADQNAIYSCQLGVDGKINQSLSPSYANGAGVEISFLNVVKTGTPNSEGNYTLVGGKFKSGILKIRQTDQGIRVIVAIEEKSADKKKNSTVQKVMVFTYSFRAGAQTQTGQNGGPQGTQGTAGQQGQQPATPATQQQQLPPGSPGDPGLGSNPPPTPGVGGNGNDNGGQMPPVTPLEEVNPPQGQNQNTGADPQQQQQ